MSNFGDTSSTCRLAAETNNNSKISQSIHSTFSFLEDRLPKSSHVLEIEMSQNLHLETPVRLFRRRIKDVPFPHLLRIVIHAYETSYGKLFNFGLGNKENGEVLKCYSKIFTLTKSIRYC